MAQHDSSDDITSAIVSHLEEDIKINILLPLKIFSGENTEQMGMPEQNTELTS